VLGWDEKAFLLKQNFFRKGDCIAEAVIRARFLKKSGGTVSPAELLELAELKAETPLLPDWVQNWNRAHS
jgi:hypothetical protein